MRKPKMILEVDIEKIVKVRRLKKMQSIVQYIKNKKGLRDINDKLLNPSMEYIDNYSPPILTYRYNGELWFREFPSYDGTEFRYKSPFID